MKVLILVLVVIAALTVIASGVWVAVALIHAICPPRQSPPARGSSPDAQEPSDDRSGA